MLLTLGRSEALSQLKSRQSLRIERRILRSRSSSRRTFLCVSMAFFNGQRWKNKSSLSSIRATLLPTYVKLWAMPSSGAWSETLQPFDWNGIGEGEPSRAESLGNGVYSAYLSTVVCTICWIMSRVTSFSKARNTALPLATRH